MIIVMLLNNTVTCLGAVLQQDTWLFEPSIEWLVRMIMVMAFTTIGTLMAKKFIFGSDYDTSTVSPSSVLPYEAELKTSIGQRSNGRCKCAYCGAPNKTESLRCTQCGAPLPTGHGESQEVNYE